MLSHTHNTRVIAAIIIPRGYAMSEFIKVARTGEIAAGEGKAVEVGGKKIAVFNVEGRFYAIDDTCTHRGGPLSEGMVEDAKVTCPWHGAIFDLSSGKVLGAPAPRDVATMPSESKARILKSTSKFASK